MAKKDHIPHLQEVIEKRLSAVPVGKCGSQNAPTM
jgi:hypothetical protein